MYKMCTLDTVKIKSKSVEISSVERPRASASMLLRQSSFKGFGQLADTSMFKRQSSLRLNDLPSTVDRHNQLHSPNSTNSTNLSTGILKSAISKKYYFIVKIFKL